MIALHQGGKQAATARLDAACCGLQVKVVSSERDVGAGSRCASSGPSLTFSRTYQERGSPRAQLRLLGMRRVSEHVSDCLAYKREAMGRAQPSSHSFRRSLGVSVSCVPWRALARTLCLSSFVVCTCGIGGDPSLHRKSYRSLRRLTRHVGPLAGRIPAITWKIMILRTLLKDLQQLVS